MMKVCRALTIALAITGGGGCDDPVSGPIGGIILVVRSVPTEAGSRFDDVERITVALERIDATTEQGTITLTTVAQTLPLVNMASDLLVAQLQAPAGDLGQLRVFASSVMLGFRDGSETVLDPDDGSFLPSWRNTGWKIELADGEPITIVEGELVGVRALLDFDDRLVQQGNGRFKVKPTLPAELFDVTPDEEPGVFADRLTVAFEQGTTPARVAELSAEIDATVLRMPSLSTWYRIKLPVSVDLEAGARHFDAKPEVVAVMPSMNFALQLDANDDDASTDNFDLVRVRDAWDTALAATGQVGSMAVRVAMIDSAIDIAHRDLYHNIGINQGELPKGLFDWDVADGVISPEEIACFDCDPVGAPDGVISIRDLECIPPTAPFVCQTSCDCAGAPPPVNCADADVLTTIRPCDANRNGRTDGVDLIAYPANQSADPRWEDGFDDDDFAPGDDKCCTDDLVGWHFGTLSPENSNDPSQPLGVGSWSAIHHGTFNAGIIGAEGDNDQDVAGVMWRVSIVPIVAAPPGGDWFPDDLFSEAIRYAEHAGLDIVNVSSGITFTKKGYEVKCSVVTRDQTFPGIVDEAFTAGLEQSVALYGALFDGGGEALYVFSGGNDGHDISDANVFSVPSQPIERAIPGATVIVGGAASSTEAHERSAYGGVTLFAPYGPWTSIGVEDSVQEVDEEGKQIVGTSHAAPTVTGAAGLLAATVPAFRGQPERLKEALIDSASGTVDASCPSSDIVDQLLLDASSLMAEQP